MTQKRNGTKGKKRKRRRSLSIMVGILYTLTAVAVIMALFYTRRSNGRTVEARAAVDNSLVTYAGKANGHEANKQTALSDTLEVQPGEPAPDRSDFAVIPGETVGTQTQSDEKIVCLTLDDGPSQNTKAVLDILDRYDVKATFFVTGMQQNYNHLIRTAYDKGHTIGLHTYSHDYATVYSSVEAYFQDLDAIGQLVKEQIGYVPCFIRFPGGSSNTISANYTSGIMSVLSGEVLKRGYQYYDWNASSGDGGVNPADAIFHAATSCNDNNIILLCHDSATKQSTVEALPKIIENYQSRGYTFQALNKQSFAAHHGISN